ncbi:PREDICTED: putative gustatory receptor 58a [Bactrocera latifrons]|uniref:putative gustatory receptor 58a n=1 Tax=Bactrocera latifrons TaxID=174628 RepID=UPI0008DD4D11|nr:PREDICTED: putative gustatory receptor 58a [Bactrocera latifrons]
MCYGTLNLYLIQMLEIRYRVYVLNTNLEKLRISLENMHRCSRGWVHGNYVSLQRLIFATTSDLGELAKVHGRLSRLLVRLNNTFKCQVISEVLSYIVTNISYCYFIYLVSNGMIETIKSPFLWVANLSTGFLALLDINLLYWISHSTTHAFQETVHILQRYRTMPFTSHNLERQCEEFCLQLWQQETDMRIGGMFSLNRQTSLAMGAFMLRHTIILVQFDYESRISGATSSITIDSLVDMF